MREMKLLKGKNFKKWSILKKFFRAFVVFLKILKSVRRRFGLKVLRFRFLPRVRKWLGLKKVDKIQKVLGCVERYVLRNGIIKSIQKWNKTVKYIQIIFIQRNIKKLQSLRKILYIKLLKSWIKHEKEFESTGNKVLSVKKEVKIAYIRKTLKVLLRKQLKENFDSDQIENKDRIFWTDLKGNRGKKKIRIETLFTKQVFWSLIRQAQYEVIDMNKTSL